MTPAQKLRTLVAGNRALIAPAVFNPLSAKLAANAGFEVLYLGGGTLGYLNCCLEANLNITQVCQAGIDIRAVTNVPLILDGAAGFGDPMHMYHTICMSEAAGFAAIEIEDQILPKRAHHHMGKEHMVPLELMAAKVREAVKARRDPDFMIIARSNGIRGPGGMADAIARGKAYRDAGADMLYFSVRNAAEAREIARAAAAIYVRPRRAWRQGRRLIIGRAGRTGLSHTRQFHFCMGVSSRDETKLRVLDQGRARPLDARCDTQGRTECRARQHRYGAHVEGRARDGREMTVMNRSPEGGDVFYRRIPGECTVPPRK